MNEILVNLIVPCVIFAACVASAIIGVFCYHCGRSNRMPLPSLPKMGGDKMVEKPVVPMNLPKVMP